MTRTVRLSDTAVSVFETDIAELADDPEGHGLNADEARTVRLIAACIDGSRFVRPDSADDVATICGELTDMANGYDDVVVGNTPGDGDQRRFAKHARDALQGLVRRLR